VATEPGGITLSVKRRKHRRLQHRSNQLGGAKDEHNLIRESLEDIKLQNAIKYKEMKSVFNLSWKELEAVMNNTIKHVKGGADISAVSPTVEINGLADK
jgi:hypothetical protein